MLRFALVFFVAVALALPGRAQEAAIEGVISSQIDAFRRDDFATAFTFASPTIRGLFETPDRFGTMVGEGYPMVHRPAEVTFLALDTTGDPYRQRLLVRDAAGALHVLEYEMVERPEGWKIGGVRILDAAEVGA